MVQCEGYNRGDPPAVGREVRTAAAAAASPAEQQQQQRRGQVEEHRGADVIDAHPAAAEHGQGGPAHAAPAAGLRAAGQVSHQQVGPLPVPHAAYTAARTCYCGSFDTAVLHPAMVHGLVRFLILLQLYPSIFILVLLFSFAFHFIFSSQSSHSLDRLIFFVRRTYATDGANTYRRVVKEEGDALVPLWGSLRRLFRLCLLPKYGAHANAAQRAGRSMSMMEIGSNPAVQVMYQRQTAARGAGGGGGGGGGGGVVAVAADALAPTGGTYWSWSSPDPTVAAGVPTDPHLLCALLRAQMWIAPDQRCVH